MDQLCRQLLIVFLTKIVMVWNLFFRGITNTPPNDGTYKPSFLTGLSAIISMLWIIVKYRVSVFHYFFIGLVLIRIPIKIEFKKAHNTVWATCSNFHISDFQVVIKTLWFGSGQRIRILTGSSRPDLLVTSMDPDPSQESLSILVRIRIRIRFR